jgi:UMF1 family MFS transporter
MKFFAYMGGMSCIMLFFFDGYNIELGIILSILASAGFAGNLVFYNAYLPVISTPDNTIFVSARGFAFGYSGSVLLLIFNLVMITFPDKFGLENESMASRISFLLVGFWWIGFSQITFYFLPKDTKQPGGIQSLVSRGYEEIKKVFIDLKKQVNLSGFLIAFFFITWVCRQ